MVNNWTKKRGSDKTAIGAKAEMGTMEGDMDALWIAAAACPEAQPGAVNLRLLHPLCMPVSECHVRASIVAARRAVWVCGGHARKLPHAAIVAVLEHHELGRVVDLREVTGIGVAHTVESVDVILQPLIPLVSDAVAGEVVAEACPATSV